MHTKRMESKKIVTIGLLSALSVVMVMILRIPFPPAPYLEYNPADVPILLGTYLYGGFTGLVITIIASGIQAMTVSAASGAIGFIMHVAATGSMCLTIGAIYNEKNSSQKRLLIASVLGAVVMIAVMVILNIVLTPMFLGVPRNQVIAGLATITIPFNLIKAAVNIGLSLVLHRVIKTVIYHSGS